MLPAPDEMARATVHRAALPKDDVEHRIAARLGRAARHAGARAGVLVLPSQAPGSLGDEAMVQSITDHLTGQGEEVAVVEYDAANRWTPRPGIAEGLVLERYFHVHRRWSLDAWADLGTFAAAVARRRAFVVVGADVVDGFYNPSRTVKRLHLALLAAHAGAEVTILNFSFNERPERRAVRALRALPASVRLVARDEIARERVRETVGRECGLAADVAFLLRPDTTGRVRAARAWCEAERAAGRVIVGVNANYQTFHGRTDAGRSELVEIYRATLASLAAAEPPASLLMIPHDWRGEETEEAFADRILEAADPRVRAHAHVVRGPYSAMEAKALAASCDLLVVGRMHLAIAGLGSGVPVASVPYQGKFEGLMRHFEAEELVLDLERALADRDMSAQLLPLYAGRDGWRARVQAALPEVKARSARAFAGGGAVPPRIPKP